MSIRTRSRAAAILAGVIVMASCGGGSEDSSDDTTPTPDATADPAADADPDGGSEPDAAEPDDAVESGADAASDDAPADDGEIGDVSDASFSPGDVTFRTVNMLDDPVDIYVVTDGIREAFTVETGVEPGDVTDFAAPPTDGRYTIVTAGSTDPTCVIDCVDTIIELSAGFPEGVPIRTVIMYPDPDDASPQGFEIWENVADEGDLAFSNAMEPADPATTHVSVIAVAVRDQPFGMRFALPDVEGCVQHLGGDSILIGGNQVLTFDVGDSTEFTIHANEDQVCDADPLGGPFAVTPAPGSRFLAVLHGQGPDIDALILALDGTPDVETPGGADEAVVESSPERDEALALMTDEVAVEFGLADEPANCLAELIVDGVDPAEIVVDGELIELEQAPDEVFDAVADALVASVEECDIDPSTFGA